MFNFLGCLRVSFPFLHQTFLMTRSGSSNILQHWLIYSYWFLAAQMASYTLCCATTTSSCRFSTNIIVGTEVQRKVQRPHFLMTLTASLTWARFYNEWQTSRTTLGEIAVTFVVCELHKFACRLHTFSSASKRPATVWRTYNPLAKAVTNYLTLKGWKDERPVGLSKCEWVTYSRLKKWPATGFEPENNRSRTRHPNHSAAAPHSRASIVMLPTYHVEESEHISSQPSTTLQTCYFHQEIQNRNYSDNYSVWKL